MPGDSWFLFFHLVGLAGFLLAHGTSAGLAFALRREREPERSRLGGGPSLLCRLGGNATSNSSTDTSLTLSALSASSDRNRFAPPWRSPATLGCRRLHPRYPPRVAAVSESTPTDRNRRSR